MANRSTITLQILGVHVCIIIPCRATSHTDTDLHDSTNTFVHCLLLKPVTAATQKK